MKGLLLDRQVLQLNGNMSISSTVSKLLLFIKPLIGMCYHGSHLGWRMASLKGEFHPVKTIECRMVEFAINLARDPRVVGGSVVVEKGLLLSAMC